MAEFSFEEAVAPAPAAPTEFSFEEAVAPARWEQAAAAHFESAARARPAETLLDDFMSGYQSSVWGLAARGALPDVELPHDAPWQSRFMAGAGQVLGDTPSYIAGFFGAAPLGSGIPVAGNVVAGLAGAGALTAALRESLIQAYDEGGVASPGEFINRTLRVAWEATKGAATMAVTGQAGMAARAALPTAPALLRETVATGVEASVATVAAKGLEGELPMPTDFADAVLLIGTMKVAGGVANRSADWLQNGKKTLQRVYAETGVKPEQVVAEAAKDPALAKEILTSDGAKVPEKYRPLAEAEAARNAIPADARLTEFVRQPFAEIPQVPGGPKAPSHVNYDYINGPTELKAAVSRLTELYAKQIETQRRGTRTVEQEKADAEALHGEVLGRVVGQADNAATLHARAQMTVDTTNALLRLRQEYVAKQEAGTLKPEDQVRMAQMVARSGYILAEHLGAAAEAGRALRILQETRQATKSAREILEVLDKQNFGPGGLQEMMDALGKVRDPAEALAVIRELAPWQVGWRRFMEYYRASLLSAMRTTQGIFVGNVVMSGTRVPEVLLSAFESKLRSAKPEDKVYAQEALALTHGMRAGMFDAVAAGRAWLDRVLGAVKTGGWRDAATVTKADYNKMREAASMDVRHSPAIPGKLGEVVRAMGYGPNSLADAVFRTINQNGTAHQLAARKALSEGLRFGSPEYAQRVADLLKSPDEAATKIIQKSGTDYTLMSELGEWGKKAQSLTHDTPLEVIFPFPRAMGNMVKAFARRTPVANSFIREWREDYAAGGVRRDQAMAQLAFGRITLATVWMLADGGHITGGDLGTQPEKRVSAAAGEQPYSVKLGDAYYGYQRMPIVGQLMGMAADAQQVYAKLDDPEEKDRLLAMLSFAFAQNVTNPTVFRGLSDVIDAVRYPDRYGERYIQNLVGKIVPNIVAEGAEGLDDYRREVDTILEAVQARIPGARESLFPAVDVWGEPIPTTDRLWPGAPFNVRQQSDDPVRLEAARLGVGIAPPPRTVRVPTKGIRGELGEVDLTPEQRFVYATVAGRQAHEIMTDVVASEAYKSAPDVIRKTIFEDVVRSSRRLGEVAAFTPEQRVSESARMVQELQRRLEAPPVP